MLATLGDWLVQAVRHILVGSCAPRGREGGPSIASFASGTSDYQPHPPSAPRARQDEALTPLLLILLLPPHPPHQNHHFPYFHCISSPPFNIAHSACRHKRVQKRFWAKLVVAGWQSSSLPNSLFLLINTYYNIDLDFHCECDTLFKT